MTEPNELVENGWIVADLRCARCMANLRDHRADGLCPGCGAAIAPSLEHGFVDERLPLGADELIDRPVPCVACGASLHGCRPDGRCPRCDAEVARSLWYAPPTDIVLLKDEAGRLIENVGCAVCGYNLRSLTVDAHCPECGATVAAALERAQRLWAERKELTTLARGMGWLMVGGVGWLLSMSAVFTGPLLAPRLGCVMTLAPLAVLIGWPTGLYLICAPRSDERYARLRRAVRIAIAVALAACVLAFVGMLVAIGLGAAGWPVVFFELVLQYLIVIADGVALFAMGGGIFVLSRSLDLVRGEAMQRQLRIVGVICLVACIVGVIALLAALVSPPVATLVIGGGLTLMTALVVWLLPLLFWFRRRVRALVRAAVAGRVE